MIELVRRYFPKFGSLQESPLLGDFGGIHGWQVTVLDTENNPVGSGFSKDSNSARKIAIAEFIERQFVSIHKGSDLAEDWRLTTHPTSCGFAVGFDEFNTLIRSTAEAIERWALSQWVDSSCFLDEVETFNLPVEYCALAKDFELFRVFRREFIYEVCESLVLFNLSVVVAFKADGAYMGSAVRTSFEESLGHAVLEAHRHLIISTQERSFQKFPFNRILYFSKNRDSANAFLESSKQKNWPNPKVEFQKIDRNEFFVVCRTILKDWTPWELGQVSRMLY